MVKIALWNIRGLNLASKRKEVKNLIVENGLCMCAVVETKVCKRNLRKFCKEMFGNWSWVSNNAVCLGRTRILIGWDPNVVKLEVFEVFEQVIHGCFYHVGSNRRIFCSMVYAANDVVSRRLLWDQLREFSLLVKKEDWVILGDFNVSLNPSDSSRGSSIISRGMLDFRECLRDIEVEDINWSGLHYTWTQKPLALEGNKGLLKKIDRVLGNLGLLGDFPSVHASFLPFGVSDHSPAVVSFPSLSSFKPRPFKFCNHLADIRGFLPLVADAWNVKVEGCTMFSVVSKLKGVKKGLRKLNFNVGNVSENVKKLRADVERNQIACDADPEDGILRNEGASYLKALKEALSAEEKFLRQKAKVHWLKEGDANTAYFHSVVKSKTNRGRIEEVENMEGQSFIGAEVPNQFILHFKEVLGKSDPVDSICDPNSLFLKKLSQVQADDMVRPIDDKEIREAIFDIDDLKAPGPDGFSSKFFKKSWPIIGSEVCEAVKQFFFNGKLLKEVNATVISLVPKSQVPKRVADFRPIACCNVIYKCISKVLVNRLKNYLDILVDKNQSAFIPNRQICDNVLLAQELMRGYHRQRGVRRCAFKVDIQKAYDTVNWNFLETALKWFGFHPCMICWIMKCVTSASFTIRVNGEHHGFFQGMRGIRQGDPLSPYLFTLVMEVLNLMVKRRVHNSDNFKFHPRCEKVGLTHLCFADDLLMFCYGDASSVRVLRDALFEFGGVSGLKPSLEKSTCFLGNVNGLNRQEILEILPFKLGTLPVRYLGVPLISTKLFHRDCLVLIDKVKRRVQDWKNKWLSFAGRLQLINSVLASISVYWASLFLLPVSVIKEVEKLLRSFLWNGGEAVNGKAKVAWKVVCLPRDKGGLGVRDLRKWNKILLTKQVWKIVGNHENLWVKWVHEYRLKGRCFWDVGSVFDASWFWIKMVRFREAYRNQICHILGDGRTTYLWSDNWHSSGPLSSFVTKRDVYMAGLEWNMKVCDIVVDGIWMWPPNIWSKAGHVLQLFQPALKEGVRDRIQWRSKEGSMVDCIVSNMWKDLYIDHPVVPWFKLIWFSQGIPRHAFFLWLAARERLRTLDRLGAWNISEDKVCVLCKNGFESHSHLFVECCYSRELWRCLEGVSGIYNLILGSFGDIRSWAELVEELSKYNYGRSIWSVVHRLVFAAGVYFLWQERNNRRYGENHRSVVVLARQVLELIKLKLMGLKVKNNDQTKRVAIIWDLEVKNGCFVAKSDDGYYGYWWFWDMLQIEIWQYAISVCIPILDWIGSTWGHIFMAIYVLKWRNKVGSWFWDWLDPFHIEDAGLYGSLNRMQFMDYLLVLFDWDYGGGSGGMEWWYIWLYSKFFCHGAVGSEAFSILFCNLHNTIRVLRVPVKWHIFKKFRHDVLDYGAISILDFRQQGTIIVFRCPISKFLSKRLLNLSLDCLISNGLQSFKVCVVLWGGVDWRPNSISHKLVLVNTDEGMMVLWFIRFWDLFGMRDWWSSTQFMASCFNWDLCWKNLYWWWSRVRFLSDRRRKKNRFHLGGFDSIWNGQPVLIDSDDKLAEVFKLLGCKIKDIGY
ncbi:hypothetical protein OSB04_un001605 [Centaurea solstitialis]|uniref:Reverse transcriptase domain-containing protein n=1 Tax=Centaurea solstitialis TaxID=347529 RepID=A0AA38SAH6_9ASTR|nr:hypothetical protein OSB04_un001605 [Centaurea solstitialis]